MKKTYKTKCFYSIKNSKAIISFIAIFLFAMSFSTKVFSQAATATWALTANTSVVTSGNITATAMTGTGITLVAYGATNGVQTNSWASATIPVTQTTEHLQFTITSTCAALTVQSVSFTHLRNGTAGAFRLRYSVNGGAYTTISDITVNAASTAYNSPALSIAVPLGQIIRFRLYGATNPANTTNLYVKNFVVTGTSASVVPSVTVAAVPSGAICASTSVTFTATPTNGGTTPAYQWKLNGSNVGLNSPNYTNAAWVNGDQVSCVLTSNLCNASPTTATSNTITMTVTPVPGVPGLISGPISPQASTTGLIYSIGAVAGATTYTWLAPVGWTITAGQGTISSTITSGAYGQNGNVTVTAGNSCGTSAASVLAVTVAPPPHNLCNGCHINHTAPGAQLTMVGGNANLCMSCHNPTGLASSLPFSNAMKAIPGTSGTSHRWDMPSTKVQYGANLTTNPAMLSRVINDTVICSTCHNQHHQTFSPFLRISNNEDSMCVNCHTVRDVRRYADNVLNKASHPIGIVYPGIGDPRFKDLVGLPLSSTGKMNCSTCHKVHYSTSTDGNILRNTNINALCVTCHIDLAPRRNLIHEGQTCISCHYSHKAGSNNILLVKDTINTPSSGLKQVIFTANTGPNNYADGANPYNGVCEVCHTLTDHYTNTAGGTSDARHLPAPQKCVNCHPHSAAFAAQTNCFDCHNAVQDKPLVGPPGGRRQIVDNTGNGLGTGGDYKRTSHHVTGAIPNVSDCILCHYMGDHKKGTVKLLDPDQGYLSVITYDPLNKSSVENFCLHCHDANGAGGDVTPFSDGVTVPIIDSALWTASAHKGNVNTNTCMNCHDNGHGSNKSTLIGPFDYAGPGTGTDLMNEEEGFCLGCHGAGGVATVKVHLAFSSYTNTATAFRKHDPTATYRKHINGENTGAAFGGANRHVECVDCHNPHGAKAWIATTAPTIYNELIGASGVTPSYAGAGAPTGFTFNSSTTYEYEVCFKCHSSYTTLPSYLPAGWTGAAEVADGLKKLTTNTNGQIQNSRDMAKEFNPSNVSFHPVMAAGTNSNINAGTFQTSWSFTSRVYCSSCHNNPNAATAGQGRGPHGSVNLHLLDGVTTAAANYKTSHNTGSASSTNEVCMKCHKPGSYNTGNTNSRFGFHQYHMQSPVTSECYVCHNSHGNEQYHLINFNRNGVSCNITWMAPATNSQNSFVHAAGTATHTCNINCHGTSHGGGKTYNPAYN